MKQTEKCLFLIHYLLKENRAYSDIEIPDSSEAQKTLLRALLNVRPPQAVSDEFLAVEDSYLQTELLQKGVIAVDDLSPLQPQLYLWRGDITRFKADAIVNAANSQMLGCFLPNHSCIDNAIHTFAGIRLRQTCNRLMVEQGHLERTGQAKITPAYNLPSQYIIHTVGPIVNQKLTNRNREALRSCYQSCLSMAEQHHLNSLVFCCISTGEFLFPAEEAAQIAVTAVKHFLQKTGSSIKVVFNVFKEKDEKIYGKLLQNS
ncbi:protein-ADP-ribose hydrolase [Streptococcus sp. H31]|uniref:protein-ADP-ribose hydrolase n=1 Tax=Streptococcus huangxiaojuni TaxID=3237239 RepID=UPI0034A4584F